MEFFRKTLDPVIAMSTIAVLDIFLFLIIGGWTVGGGETMMTGLIAQWFMGDDLKRIPFWELVFPPHADYWKMYISLGMFFVRHVGTTRWPAKRNHLLLRALVVLLSYKALCFVQMFQTYSGPEVLATLGYLNFPDFAEVLNFYSFAIVWITLLLPLWVRIPLAVKPILVIGLWQAGQYLEATLEFGDFWPIKAILCEQRGAYCFGQLQRGECHTCE